MKRSEYKELLTFSEDPYQGFIRYNEDRQGRDVTGEELDLAMEELSSMGYCLYVHSDGVLESAFITEALEECRRSIESAGVDGEAGAVLPELIYCDEDRLTEAKSFVAADEEVLILKGCVEAELRTDPFFKPDFSPDTLESFFYIGGALLIKEGTEKTFVNSITDRDYLRLGGRILTAFKNNTEGYRAVHLKKVYYHSITPFEYSYPEGIHPLLPRSEEVNDTEKDREADKSIRTVILSKDNPQMLLRCIDSLKKNSDMKMAVTVVDNGSNNQNRIYLSGELSARGVEYICHPMEFIYSALCNLGVEGAKESFFLFLNDDIILPDLSEDFPSSLIEKASQPHVGAVGAKLLYPEQDGTEGGRLIQHAGIALLRNGPSHKLCTYDDSRIYERGRNRGNWNVMAVTGACLAVRAEKFRAVGGFDERLRISYTDVDLCMDLYDKGFYNVVMNDIRLLHYESVSRGRDDSDKKAERLKGERDIFYGKHPALLFDGDPFYNENLTSVRLDYSAEFILPWEDDTLDVPLDERYPGLGVKRLGEDRLLWSIDRVEYRAALFEDDEPHYEIDGWCILKGQDMTAIAPAVELRIGDKRLLFTAVRKPRLELSEVFPKEKNVLLSGFISRIPERYPVEALSGGGGQAPDSEQARDALRQALGGERAKDAVMPALLKEGFFGSRSVVVVS